MRSLAIQDGPSGRPRNDYDYDTVTIGEVCWQGHPFRAHDPSGLTSEFLDHSRLMAPVGCLGTILLMLLGTKTVTDNYAGVQGNTVGSRPVLDCCRHLQITVADTGRSSSLPTDTNGITDVLEPRRAAINI